MKRKKVVIVSVLLALVLALLACSSSAISTDDNTEDFVKFVNYTIQVNDNLYCVSEYRTRSGLISFEDYYLIEGDKPVYYSNMVIIRGNYILTELTEEDKLHLASVLGRK